MDKLEEVKKILIDYDVLRLTGEEMAVEICQLFEPKPDQSIAEQVLTELKDDLAELSQQIRVLPDEPILNLGDEVLHKIVAKTAEIKDKECSEYANELRRDYEDGIKRAKDFVKAECQARIEALMAFVGSFLDDYEIDEPYKAVKEDLIVDIINKLNEALKATYTSKEKEG